MIPIASRETTVWSELNPIRIVREFYTHRGLLWQLTVRNIQIRHKGSYLGLLWAVFTPLLMMGLYYFVFGLIFERNYGILEEESAADFALGLFLSLSLYQFLAEALMVAPIVIVNSPNLVKKIVFPLRIIPVATLGAALFHFLVSIGLFFLGLIFFGNGLNINNLWFPVILLPLIFLTMGLTWLLASLGVFFRDISHIMQFATTAILYASAVFYSASMVPLEIWEFLKYNPMIHIVELSRNVLLWNIPMNVTYLFYLYGVGILFFFLGYGVFQKLKPAFADVM